MDTFVTHQSVRIKGTENNYIPMQCIDPTCPSKAIHMHCPFCVTTEAYQDPVILKAHYRVKHVDKGIDFAGLKVLRCCDHCDIIGIIKGEKKFKGAHWHCYKCRNGFNRRDEAIKHYKTHFRNPKTTFQIQVAQDVYQPPSSLKAEVYAAAHTVSAGDDVLSESITDGDDDMEDSMDMTNGTSGDVSDIHVPVSANEVQVSVAANETVDATDGQTIMIIQDDGQLGAHPTSRYTSQMQVTNDMYDTSGSEHQGIDWRTKYSELHEKYADLVKKNMQDEEQSLAEIDQLKLQLQIHQQELTNAQKREQGLIEQLTIPLDKRIQDVLHQLETQHKDLLHHQLALVRRVYIGEMQQQHQQPGGEGACNDIVHESGDGEPTDSGTVSLAQGMLILGDNVTLTDWSADAVTVTDGVHIADHDVTPCTVTDIVHQAEIQLDDGPAAKRLKES